MSRKYQKRTLLPDYKYQSTLVAKLINYVLRKGKKELASKIVYQALEDAAQKTKTEPLEVLAKAVKNVGPIVEVRPRRVGGANYQVPIEVREPRRTALALRWIVGAAKIRGGKPMVVKLSNELVDAYNQTGVAIKKKETIHKIAEANRAFAHYARF